MRFVCDTYEVLCESHANRVRPGADRLGSYTFVFVSVRVRIRSGSDRFGFVSGPVRIGSGSGSCRFGCVSGPVRIASGSFRSRSDRFGSHPFRAGSVWVHIRSGSARFGFASGPARICSVRCRSCTGPQQVGTETLRIYVRPASNLHGPHGADSGSVRPDLEIPLVYTGPMPNRCRISKGP